MLIDLRKKAVKKEVKKGVKTLVKKGVKKASGKHSYLNAPFYWTSSLEPMKSVQIE